jgi:hypothetical protein
MPRGPGARGAGAASAAPEPAARGAAAAAAASSTRGAPRASSSSSSSSSTSTSCPLRLDHTSYSDLCFTQIFRPGFEKEKRREQFWLSLTAQVDEAAWARLATAAGESEGGSSSSSSASGRGTRGASSSASLSSSSPDALARELTDRLVFALRYEDALEVPAEFDAARLSLAPVPSPSQARVLPASVHPASRTFTAQVRVQGLPHTSSFHNRRMRIGMALPFGTSSSSTSPLLPRTSFAWSAPLEIMGRQKSVRSSRPVLRGADVTDRDPPADPSPAPRVREMDLLTSSLMRALHATWVQARAAESAAASSATAALPMAGVEARLPSFIFAAVPSSHAPRGSPVVVGSVVRWTDDAVVYRQGLDATGTTHTVEELPLRLRLPGPLAAAAAAKGARFVQEHSSLSLVGHDFLRLFEFVRDGDTTKSDTVQAFKRIRKEDTDKLHEESVVPFTVLDVAAGGAGGGGGGGAARRTASGGAGASSSSSSSSSSAGGGAIVTLAVDRRSWPVTSRHVDKPFRLVYALYLGDDADVAAVRRDAGLAVSAAGGKRARGTGGDAAGKAAKNRRTASRGSARTQMEEEEDEEDDDDAGEDGGDTTAGAPQLTVDDRGMPLEVEANTAIFGRFLVAWTPAFEVKSKASKGGAGAGAGAEDSEDDAGAASKGKTGASAGSSGAGGRPSGVLPSWTTISPSTLKNTRGIAESAWARSLHLCPYPVPAGGAAAEKKVPGKAAPSSKVWPPADAAGKSSAAKAAAAAAAAAAGAALAPAPASVPAPSKPAAKGQKKKKNKAPVLAVASSSSSSSSSVVAASQRAKDKDLKPPQLPTSYPVASRKMTTTAAAHPPLSARNSTASDSGSGPAGGLPPMSRRSASLPIQDLMEDEDEAEDEGGVVDTALDLLLPSLDDDEWRALTEVPLLPRPSARDRTLAAGLRRSSSTSSSVAAAPAAALRRTGSGASSPSAFRSTSRSSDFDDAVDGFFDVGFEQPGKRAPTGRARAAQASSMNPSSSRRGFDTSRPGASSSSSSSAAATRTFSAEPGAGGRTLTNALFGGYGYRGAGGGTGAGAAAAAAAAAVAAASGARRTGSASASASASARAVIVDPFDEILSAPAPFPAPSSSSSSSSSGRGLRRVPSLTINADEGRRTGTAAMWSSTSSSAASVVGPHIMRLGSDTFALTGSGSGGRTPTGGKGGR